MSAPPPSLLDCGRDALELVEQVVDGTPAVDPAHQAACASCQQALERLRAAAGQLQELAAEPIAVPRSLTTRVMSQLRREQGRVSLAAGPLGADTASDLVVLQITRRAARAISGVRRCSVALDSQTPDGELVLTVHLTAALGPALPALAEEVRRAVAADLAGLTGLRVGRVEVHVDDVHVDLDG